MTEEERGWVGNREGEGREGGRERKKGGRLDLNLQAHSLIFSAISQFKGHHNYDGDKTMPAYVC